MQHLAVSNASLAVDVRGKGPRILFVHGFPLTHTMWNAQLDEFSSTHRVLAPDLRGFGDSTITPDVVRMQDFADDLHGLMHAAFMEGPVILCGLSMGGYVAFEFVRKYRRQLKALILCDTWAVADTPEAADGRRKLAEKVLAEGMQVAVDAMLPKLLAPQTREKQPAVVAELRSMILRNKPAGIAAALHGMAERPDSTALLPQIDVPTLVLCGQDDAIAGPAEMRTIAEAIPGAQFAVIPDAGHMAPMENPRTVNAEMGRFLDSLASLK